MPDRNYTIQDFLWLKIYYDFKRIPEKSKKCCSAALQWLQLQNCKYFFIFSPSILCIHNKLNLDSLHLIQLGELESIEIHESC